METLRAKEEHLLEESRRQVKMLEEERIKRKERLKEKIRELELRQLENERRLQEERKLAEERRRGEELALLEETRRLEEMGHVRRLQIRANKSDSAATDDSIDDIVRCPNLTTLIMSDSPMRLLARSRSSTISAVSQERNTMIS